MRFVMLAILAATLGACAIVPGRHGGAAVVPVVPTFHPYHHGWRY